MATLSTILSVRAIANLVDALGSYSPGISLPNLALDNGTGSNQASVVYAKSVTVADSSTPSTFDLSGSLLQPNGSAAVFTKGKLIFYYCPDTNTVDVSIGGGTNPFTTYMSGTTPKDIIQPGGLVLRYAPITGYAIANGSTDIVTATIASGTNQVVYVLIVGIP